jgi:NADH:ubiquinone oxidoreductase subunit K
MKVGLAQALFVAVALLSAGGFTIGYRRSPAAALVGVPVALAGAGLALVAVSRFAASGLDPFGGQLFAILIAIAGLAFTGLAAGWLAEPPEELR